MELKGAGAQSVRADERGANPFNGIERPPGPGPPRGAPARGNPFNGIESLTPGAPRGWCQLRIHSMELKEGPVLGASRAQAVR